MASNYLAITIGPIYKTFQNVRKTRELWAASYIFSFLSRRLIETISLRYPGSIIVPHYDKGSPKGIGLYPDRIYIMQEDDNAMAAIDLIKSNIITEISGWMEPQTSYDFLAQYFRIYTVKYSIEHGENPLVIANKLLDTAELRSTWQLNETTNTLLYFFREVNTVRTNNNKWIKDHLAEKDVFDEVRFESLPEISTRAIREINKEGYKMLVKKYCYTDKDLDLEDGFIKEIQKMLKASGHTDTFKNYHKYVCIVKADGDKVGKYIKAIHDNFELALSGLSKSLYEWGLESASLIKAYSGVPIYIGGDDLLFLAPVVGKNNQTILDLTKTLNICFEKHFSTLPVKKDDDKNAIKPTLSFGISITYYKYPLFEALRKADDLLYKSKDTRNACSISLLKHSGSSFDITVSNAQTDPINDAFSKVNEFFIDNTSFVSSIIHHFRENESAYRLIGNDKNKVSCFLRNNFEEKKFASFVEGIATLCYAVYCRNHGTASKEASEISIREIYSLLRILKFLNGQDDGK